MRFCVLGSGSKGNSTVVESAGEALLIDAGFSGVEIERRLAAAGLAPEAVRGILITHEHGDHVRGAGVFSRKHRVPLLVNAATFEAAGKALENPYGLEIFKTGTPFAFGRFRIHPFAVSHDTADPVGFRLDDGRHRLGYCTDTGTVSRLIHHHLRQCHGLVIESNHDPVMLRNSPYPPATQQRIRSKGGHLANPQAVDFLASLLHNGLRHVVLAHISETNNCHRLVEAAVNDRLAAELTRHGVTVSLARQEAVGPLVDLRLP